MTDLSDLDTLLALEEIKLLKARHDRAVDTKDWDTCLALHAPDHISFHEGSAPWNGAQAMIENIRCRFGPDIVSVHQSHTPEIAFESPQKANGVWAVEDNLFWEQGGEAHWTQGFGFYHETYEKRDDTWLFTRRRFTRTHVRNSKSKLVVAGTSPSPDTASGDIE